MLMASFLSEHPLIHAVAALDLAAYPLHCAVHQGIRAYKEKLIYVYKS
jgi:hypothetical protein